MKKIILIAAVLVTATLMSAPTERVILPEEEPERETAAEVYELVREMTVTEPDLHMKPQKMHDDVRKVRITERNLHIEAEAVGPETPEEAPAEVEETAPAVWRNDVPLRPELQQVLLDACAEAGIDPLLMLGLIETESNFQEDAVSDSKDYGLCQLHYLYFDPNMPPEENIQAGVSLLGKHLKTYGEISAALTAYHVGHDDGTRSYANAVLGKAAAWGYTA